MQVESGNRSLEESGSFMVRNCNILAYAHSLEDVEH
jgi:hypothetical protein